MPSWWDTIKGYACSVVIGALIIPLVFVPGVGWEAAYTVGTVVFGAGAGAFVHGSGMTAGDMCRAVGPLL